MCQGVIGEGVYQKYENCCWGGVVKVGWSDEKVVGAGKGAVDKKRINEGVNIAA